MIENVVIEASAWQDRDIENLFGDEPVHFSSATDLQSLMLELKVFPSKSASMRAGREGPIPTGLTEFKASKKRRLWIWNPTQ